MGFLDSDLEEARLRQASAPSAETLSALSLVSGAAPPPPQPDMATLSAMHAAAVGGDPLPGPSSPPVTAASTTSTPQVTGGSGTVYAEDLPGYDPNWTPPDNTVTETPAAVQGGQISDATAFNPAVLAQILASLEAQYGLSAEQLMADQSEVGRLYQFITSNLGRMEAEATRGETESSLGRGILQSGIHLENQANVERDFAERRASAEGEQAQQLTYIQNQVAQLQAQLEADRMQAAQGFGQQGLDYASQYAGTAPAAGFPGGVQAGQQVSGNNPSTPQGLPLPYPGPGGQNPTMMTPEMLAILAQQQQPQFIDPYAHNR